jgi:predicted N-acetyltransferase YhbS
MIIRELRAHELDDIWSIDRSETIDHIYYHRDGELVLEPEHYDMTGWPPSVRESAAPGFADCFQRGGTFYGAFDGDQMVGVVILECRFMGREDDQLQLKFLQVSHDYRKRGLGRSLFEKAVARAKALGAKRLYVSATPSENTVGFYLHLGCQVTDEVDPALFAEEPKDIHLEYPIP